MLEGVTWPAWIGTPSQLALLVVVSGSIIIGYIKVLPQILKLRQDERTSKRELEASERDRIAGYYRTEVQALKERLEACEKKCSDDNTEAQKKIDYLQGRVSNEALQRVQSEISLVNTLIQVVDAPQLRTILTALEKRKVLLADLGSLILNGEGAEDEPERS
jgi:hypothetical protein